ncbi:MAG: serpin family protein [Pirellulales bacterium]|nr:serpin family protein [Pirellulales bacterium]
MTHGNSRLLTSVLRIPLPLLLIAVGVTCTLADGVSEYRQFEARFTARVDSIKIDLSRTALPVGIDARWKVTGEILSVEKACPPFEKPGKFEIAIHSPAQSFHQSAEEAVGKTFRFRARGIIMNDKPEYVQLTAHDVKANYSKETRAAFAKYEKLEPSLPEINNAFAFDLYRQLGKEPGNLFFSPASVSIALSMAAAGAKGETQKEMLKALHVGQDAILSHVDDAYRRLLDDWNSAGKKFKFHLHVANRLWGQEGFSFVPGFLTLTKQQYGAELGRVDFETQAEAARREINQWVAEQTAEKIKNLMPPGSVTAATRLVLTNAVYFKGDWMSPFKRSATRDGVFTVSSAEKLKTPFMRQTSRFGYAENDAVQALELPYVGFRLAMVVLLPRKIDGLAEVEKTLDAKSLEKLLSGMEHQEVRVALPKFKLETPSIKLNGPLEKLGIRKAFTTNADFSGISTEEKLFISGVYHKAFVDVYEEGTEAAAATGMGMAMAAPPPQAPPPVFRADHPFLFLIRDVQNGAILFLGRLEKPRS